MRRVMWVFAAAIALALLGWLLAPYARSAAFILDLTGSTSWARRLLPVRVQTVRLTDLTVPSRYGNVAARLYRASSPTRTVVVFPGVHRGGVDEPRLDTFARRLAATGSTVLSVPLPALREYRITPESTDIIEDAARWLSEKRDLSPTGRVGLIGVSFSGGLALVAAARPAIRDRIQLVVSLGGHADLPRVMRFLCTGRLPDGSTRPPHDYGVAIILRGSIHKVVPESQSTALEHALQTFLDASGYDTTDPARSRELFEQAKRESDTLPEPARTLMGYVNTRNVSALGQILLPFVEELGGAPVLSPDRSPATTAPAFLLHGADDNVVPSQETPLAAEYLRSQGNRHVEWLLTPLLSHANVQPVVHAPDAWRLISFWKKMLGSD